MIANDKLTNKYDYEVANQFDVSKVWTSLNVAAIISLLEVKISSVTIYNEDVMK